MTITVTFLILKKTVGLRVDREEEIRGLDSTEHGLPSAYADFVPAVEKLDYGDAAAAAVAAVVAADDAPAGETIPAGKAPAPADGTAKFTKIEIVCKEARLETLKAEMMQIGITGMTV